MLVLGVEQSASSLGVQLRVSAEIRRLNVAKPMLFCVLRRAGFVGSMGEQGDRREEGGPSESHSLWA